MIDLIRDYSLRNDCVIGTWYLPDGSTMLNLERPWLNNQPFVSCIPEGVYKVNRDLTGKHQWYALENVPERSFIEIHPVTRVHHLEGCLSPFLSYTEDPKGLFAYGGDEACTKLLNLFGEHSWIVRIAS